VTARRRGSDAGVAAADRLAAAAGAEMLRRGGSAADGAVAAAAVMSVTSPHFCGLGGDLFALVQVPGDDPVALNASGRAGSGADPAALRAEGHTSMPLRGDVRSVTVPGCLDGLLALAARFGRLEPSELFAPAIALANEGFRVSPTLAAASHGLAPSLRARAFGGPEPLIDGARLAVPGVGRALHAAADGGRAAYYEGQVGEELRALGEGLFTVEDLRRPIAEWVAPLSLDAFGATLWTTPPNSQGFLTLAGAWIAENVGPGDDPNDERWPFVLIEAARQAAYDRPAVLYEDADGAVLLAPERLTPRARAIGHRASTSLPGVHAPGDTTYLCAVDEGRSAVSLILSNCAGFGAHLLLGESGVFLHDRGVGFALTPGHVAEYGPGRRPPHTLSPALVTADGRLRAVLGTMGGDAQPQVLLQLLARTLMCGQDPQTAIDAPRWMLTREPTTGFDTWDDPDPPIVALEPGAPPAWAPGLRDRGHRVRVAAERSFGHAQMIAVTNGGLVGAADPRTRNGGFVTVADPG
jgi:gamma-glutamyltranspeptidase/glutathione hydrolase